MSDSQPPSRPGDRPRKHWGWGYADQQPDRAGLEAMVPLVRERLGFPVEKIEEPVAEADVELAPPRTPVPDSLAHLVSDSRHERLTHAMGKAYRDVVRGFRGIYERTPDMVAFPADEDDVRRVLELADDRRLAVIPYGGGSSVVGGVEPRVGLGYRGTVTVDLSRLDRVLEVDEHSMAARIQGGALGPDLERQLGERGLTLRHFPQSFEHSTLGGWIATRAGGHFATVRHPHRRSRRVGPGDHARGHLGEPAPAGLGRRPEPGPDAGRLGGDPRPDHRGLGPGPPPADLQALVRRQLRRLPRGRRGRPRSSPSPVSTPPTCACSTRSRR